MSEYSFSLSVQFSAILLTKISVDPENTVVLVVTDVSGRSVGPIFKVQAVQEIFFDCQLPPTSQRCVTSQKSEDLNNAAAEARYLAVYCLLDR
jgi:hypothetical protein